MRSISRPRNRLVLIFVGTVLFLAGAAALIISTPVQFNIGSANRYLPEAGTRISEVISWEQSWVLPTLFAASIAVVIIGVVILLSQIPKKAVGDDLRITDESGEVLGSVDPKVLQRALEETVQQLPGVSDCVVTCGGSASSPWLQASLTVSEHAQVQWVVQQVRNTVADLVAQTVGTQPERVDIQVKISPSSQSRKAIAVPSADLS